ncbi:HNH endonuclease [Thalassospira profundimaris]|uniref:HNH endonuclease n=1 Tax=Thalassospira profundimaris TaxID=502049 RepID=UPI001EE63769|nr:HNH endonuclease signature motif containing protein [Thalassospira profundimaris]
MVIPGNSDSSDLGKCAICGRAMIAGPSVDRHHWHPKSQGGTETEWLHRVCHRMIHRLFDEATLARDYNSPDKLLAHPDIIKFVKWVRKKPVDYIDWPESAGRYGRNRGKRR